MKKRTIKRITAGALALTCAVAGGIYFNGSKNANAGTSNTKNCYMGVGVYNYLDYVSTQCIYFADIDVDTMEKSKIISSTLLTGDNGEFYQSEKHAEGGGLIESNACYTNADYIGDNTGKYKATGKGAKSCIVATDVITPDNFSAASFTGKWVYDGETKRIDNHVLKSKGEAYYVSSYK